MKSTTLIAILSLTAVHAYSTFGGQRLNTQVSNGGSMTMKKGKPNVPPQMRGAYKRNQQLAQQRDAMIAATQPGADGLPVFNLFVRTKVAKQWYPCGSFKGDERSAALAKSYADGGMFSGMSKSQMDKGVSGSLFRDLDKLQGALLRQYPQLKGKELEYGYKLAFEGLSEEQGKIAVIEVKEQSGVLDGVLNNLFGK